MRKQRSRKRLPFYLGYALAAALGLLCLTLPATRNIIKRNAKYFFSRPHLYDRYDRKWLFKGYPNAALLLIQIEPESFVESGQMQNMIWAYIWSLFIKKYTKLSPTIVLDIPENTKSTDLDKVKDNLSSLYEQFSYVYKDAFIGHKVDFVFEDASRFRKSENIGKGIKLLIVDNKSKKHLIDVDSISELHGPLVMSMLYDYTPIMEDIFAEVFKEIDQKPN